MHLYRPLGISHAREILARATKILVYYDPDVDGLVAGHFVVSILKKYNRPYMYYINENRQHGMYLSDEQLQQLKGYTIIAVDFSIPMDTLEKMLDYGISVLNIDHHAINSLNLMYNERNGCEYVVINNQYPFEKKEWAFLSGAGMVYYVMSALFPDWGEDIDNVALMGVTLLSDIRCIENQYAYEILKVTYNWESDFSKYLIKLATYGANSYSFGVQKYLDRNFIDYSFSPRFNALFRLNLGDVAVRLIEQEPLELSTLNQILRLPQDNSVLNLTYVVKHAKGVLTKMLEKLEIVRYSGLCVCYLNEKDLSNELYNISNFVGLVAGHIKDIEGLTTIVLVHNDSGIVRGSLRGLYDGVDYLNTCRKHGVECEGHLGAFGILHCDNIDFSTLATDIMVAEGGRVFDSTRIIEVSSMEEVLSDTVTAEYNAYVRTSHMRYYRYTGGNYFETVHNEKFINFDIEGVSVKCFDTKLNPNNALILPVLNNGYVEYILEKIAI